MDLVILFLALFNSIDVNGDKRLSRSELKALVVGLELSDKIIEDFEISENGEIEFKEFATGLTKWLEKARGLKRGLHMSGSEIMKYLRDYNDALGASVVAAPLVDVITQLSAAINISSFFVSFILLHFITNSSKAVSALMKVTSKLQLSTSCTFSELYGIFHQKCLLS
ncbi:Calcium-binding EF-hand [Artemisia annua]|uniref:Calcium-binding EF-hand n=1 Tax=Artemisia annua TaxID=35608 RepID=A0A2U1P895_ARTAN|nr:Calcium-binding EF-hand [Artemisia annua]